jgi:cytoskeleton protein RodZ
LASTVTPQLATLETAPAPAVAPASPAEAPVKEAPAPAPVAAADGGGSRRIALRFEQESWVEVRARGGKLLMASLNPAGSERVVEGKPPFNVVIGNAHHVRLSYDDREMDLGPHIKVEVARFTLE